MLNCWGFCTLLCRAMLPWSLECAVAGAVVFGLVSFFCIILAGDISVADEVRAAADVCTSFGNPFLDSLDFSDCQSCGDVIAYMFLAIILFILMIIAVAL